MRKQKKIIAHVQGRTGFGTVGEKVEEKLKQDEFLAGITYEKLNAMSWSELLTLALKVRKRIEAGDTSSELKKKDSLVCSVIYDKSRQNPR